MKEGRDAADDLVSYHPHCHRHHQSLFRVFYSLPDDWACLNCFPVTYLLHSEGPKPQYIPYINILSVVLQQFTSCFLWALMSKQVHFAGAEHYIHVPFSVEQYAECPLRDREAPGSIPGRGTPKSLIMLLVAPRLALRFSG